MRVNRGFLAGVAWGGAVAGLGLAVISQVLPQPLQQGAGGALALSPVAEAGADVNPLAAPARPVTEPAITPAAAPAPQAVPPAEPQQAPMAEQATGTEPAPGTVPSAEPQQAPMAEQVTGTEPAPGSVPTAEPQQAPVAEQVTGTEPAQGLGNIAAPVPEVPADPGPATGILSQAPSGPAAADTPARPVIPALSPSAAPAPAPEGARTLAPAPAPAKAPTVTSDVPRPPPEEAMLTPPPVPAPAPAAARVAGAQDPETDTLPLPQTTPPAPDASPAVALARPLPVPDTAADPAPDPASKPQRTAPQAPRRLEPDPALVGTGGVRVGQLPRIGTQEVAEDPAPATTEVAADAPPVERFARSFENPEGRPLFSILLRDTGGADVDRVALAEIAFPVTFVIDPMLPGAAQAAEIYRASGQEVLMLASGIPEGATPGDLEQTFQSLEGVLPEAVGVMDQPEGGFQGNRPLAAQVVPILAGAGRGIVTFDVGLNAADQEARRAALPAAMIFRRLDAEGEDSPVIRRYLDRAAFKAAQEGRVVVLGDTRPETVTAILEWAIEGRSASVALAPVTAVMQLP